MNEYVNQMLAKYGLSTSLDQKVGLEFIDFEKSNVSKDDRSESQITDRSLFGYEEIGSPNFRQNSIEIDQGNSEVIEYDRGKV